ncbi:sensor histidine kinase [Prosthecobacter sp.]|jgi:signal transduction histidine kinase|uniref:sensor histidine kinase n=1 Tax=Prosthecobacter sp. TaxID=1965333 RepID=UPI0037839DE3
MTTPQFSTNQQRSALARLVVSFVIASLRSLLRSSTRFAVLAVSLCSALQSSFALGVDSRWVDRLAFWSWGELETLESGIRERDQRLARLPGLMLINSCLRVGLKTGYTTDEYVRWFELTLKESTSVDSIVLVPPLAKGANAVVAGYGFPVRFKLEVFDEQDRAHVVLDQTRSDFPNPGCFPVVAHFEPRVIKRARFTATEPWSVDGPEILAMAEMLVLSGDRNLALEAAVTSSSSRNAPRAWTRLNLIDMITPLGLPVEPQSAGTNGYHSAVSEKADAEKTLTLTLPEVTPLDEIRLVPVRRKDVPLWFDYGFPVTYKIEAATKEDFSDAILVHEAADRLAPTPGMNLVCIPTRGLRTKHVRITTKQLWYRKSDHVFALAEFQAFSGGRNVALHGKFSASDMLTGEEAGKWSLDALNDGLTEGGRLITLPEWFERLETRQKLERERDELRARRDALLARSQHQLVYVSVAGTGAITLLSALLLWRQQRDRRRDARLLRDKLARDLHDEIGSNLGSITLICSIANQSDATLDSMKADITEIERVAAETADSMRDMVDLIRPRRSETGADWLDVLHRLAERLLRGLTLDCALPAAPLTVQPDIETRRELYLFCKEVLHNIARHAQATRARFHLTPTNDGLRVEISDNGVGFDTSRGSVGHGLGNLRERAAAMHAVQHLTSEAGKGTHVVLDVPRTARWGKPET